MKRRYTNAGMFGIIDVRLVLKVLSLESPQFAYDPNRDRFVVDAKIFARSISSHCASTPMHLVMGQLAQREGVVCGTVVF